METIKVGLDFGASRIKYVYMGKDNILKNGIILNRYMLGENNANTGYKVVREDHINRIGVVDGIPNIQKNKIYYEYLDDIILATCKDVKDNARNNRELNLVINALLPPTQFIEDYEKFQEKLLSFNQMSGQVNNDYIKVNIKEVGICCEGVSLLVAMDMYNICPTEKALLIDAGSSTTDIVQLECSNGHWNVINAYTIDTVAGSIIIQDIATELKKEFSNAYINAAELERTMYFYAGLDKHRVIDYVEYAAPRIQQLQKIFNDYYRGGAVLISGGAGELLMASNTFKSLCSVEPILLSEDLRIYGNARGAYLS